MQEVVIFGIGGMAKEIAYLVEYSLRDEFSLMGFSVDDVYYKNNMQVLEHPVFKRDWLIEHKDEVLCVCGVGYPKERRKVMNSLEEEGVKFATIIHPTAAVIDRKMIGDGSIIGAYCFVSADVSIGKGVFLNGMVNIGHDCVLEDYVTCFPKAQVSGGCMLGEASLIGSMSYIHEKKKVGKEAVVAPGSMVLHNVKDRMHVIGNPAKSVEI